MMNKENLNQSINSNRDTNEGYDIKSYIDEIPIDYEAQKQKTKQLNENYERVRSM